MEALGFKLREEAVLQTLTQDVLKTSEIEGEQLDAIQVRSWADAEGRRGWAKHGLRTGPLMRARRWVHLDAVAAYFIGTGLGTVREKQSTNTRPVTASPPR